MTSEAAFTKLMWVLGREEGVAATRKWFETDICHEITL
jgi:L-asparaginase/Glu-tRNA(Gln) amidotransferase subunit D